MQPPLTDLSWVTWLVWADWCADYRPKGEAFARKVAKSLRKMEAVGCDPKMGLYCTRRSGWRLADSCYGFIELVYGEDENGYYRTAPAARGAWECPAKLSGAFWLWYGVDRLNYSPADLPKHWQQTRLAWKFWKCVNRRALGIKDSVLEG